MNDAWLNLYRQPKKDKAREWYSSGERSFAVSGNFGPRMMMVALAMDVNYFLDREKEY